MNECLPMVTVVITTYKRPVEIVKRAINSVLQQSYKKLEVIVVDDSPNSYELRNKIKECVEAYPNKVTYIQHEKNMGACVARNTGLKNAHGEYIAYLDDDDEWESTKIEKQIQCFNSKEIALVYCGHRIKDDSKNEMIDGKCKYREGYLYEELLIEGNFVGSTSFSLIKKECLENVGGFDPLMESAQDADVWLRLAKKYKITCVKEPLVIYHIHEGERITTNPKKKINGIERIIEKNKEFLESNKRAFSRLCRVLAPLYARDGNFGEATKKCWEAIKCCPDMCMENFKCICKVILYFLRTCI